MFPYNLHKPQAIIHNGTLQEGTKECLYCGDVPYVKENGYCYCAYCGQSILFNHQLTAVKRYIEKEEQPLFFEMGCG